MEFQWRGNGAEQSESRKGCPSRVALRGGEGHNASDAFIPVKVGPQGVGCKVRGLLRRDLKAGVGWSVGWGGFLAHEGEAQGEGAAVAEVAFHGD